MLSKYQQLNLNIGLLESADRPQMNNTDTCNLISQTRSKPLNHTPFQNVSLQWNMQLHLHTRLMLAT